MRLVMIATDPKGYRNEFSGDLPTLEAGLDFLSKIVKKRHVLLKAELIDGNQRISLPVAAFDGVPFSEALKALQNEWQAILDRSCQKDLVHADQVLLARYSLQQCDLLIAHHKRMIHWTNNLLLRKQPGELSRFAGYYEQQLSYHQRKLAEVQVRSSLRTDWLNQLLV